MDWGDRLIVFVYPFRVQGTLGRNCQKLDRSLQNVLLPMSFPSSLQTITPDHPAYPTALHTCPAFKTPPSLFTIGNLALLAKPAIALFCSSQCPDDLTRKIYDLTQALCDANIPVISGFHSPIEQDCLTILSRGTQPIIHCPARSLHNLRLSSEQQQAIAENRLLLLSPFSASYGRATTQLAEKRNKMIGAIAPLTFIAYAAPNNNTIAFARYLIEAKSVVKTFNDPLNSPLHELGIVGLDLDSMIQFKSFS
jgi:predicted Rossmann fold nucleotide-binding protein DprA/Smf involved in DNA uptake